MKKQTDTTINHRILNINGIDMHIAEAGIGYPVILLHGFPELWYSWRQQLPELADEGYHAIAPDARGCGQSGAPQSIGEYSMYKMTDDIIGLMDAIGEEKAILVGHDWGVLTAIVCAQRYSERISAVAALDVSFTNAGIFPRQPAPSIQSARKYLQYIQQNPGGIFDYNNFLVELMLYHQEPGVAEAGYEADIHRTFRRLFYAMSGDAPADLMPHLVTRGPLDGHYIDRMPEPESLPAWLTTEELNYYANEYKRTGFTGALNRYRNLDRDWADHAELANTIIQQPALFISGEYDQPTRFGRREPQKPWVPNLRDIIIFPGCGHWMQQEQPKKVNKYLITFLNSLSI